ncbi:MAG: acyl-CoA thioesterase [Lachnospiraceae bacterium]|nr:acyl-CoA thioesterase [Lachnospiraceae bacterium]
MHMTKKTTSVQIVLAQHCNGNRKPRLFGGQLMAWIDVVGAVAARRFAKAEVTTVCVDNLTFLKPAYLNDILVQEAWVTWSGNTSLEVRIDTYVEHETRELVNRAYAVYVALDADEKPTKVPEFIPETQEEMDEYAMAVERKVIRMQMQQN